jgi:hypothetical protein
VYDSVGSFGYCSADGSVEADSKHDGSLTVDMISTSSKGAKEGHEFVDTLSRRARSR